VLCRLDLKKILIQRYLALIPNSLC
jgi:hypothetical protein